jgi:TolB-like protein/Tfp pilus assembly protein PilF
VKLFNELKRRNVFRVALGYIIAGWLVLQVTDVMVSLLELPSLVGRFVFYGVLLGFPLALFFSWVFQLTPEGLKRDSELEPSDVATIATTRKLDIVIIVLLVISLGFLALDRFVLTEPTIVTTEAAPDWYDRSIAVIPFEARGDEEEGGLFAEGIHDDLLTQLAKIADLHVISRTSVMGYAGTTMKIPEIGAELGVRHILEGGVQKVGTQVRINAQLIDAQTDKHLWAETFDREFTVDNIFKVQSEIVHRITDSLHTTILPETEESIARTPTENLDAYQDYLAGLHGQFRPDVRRELFQSAIEKDPQFALAWIQLVISWQQTYWFDPEQPEALERAEEAYRRAEAIDPDLPQLHFARALIEYHGYLNYDAALQELEIAEQGLPGDSSIPSLRATIYRHMRRIPEAIAAYNRALELDPRDPFVIYELGITLSIGRYHEQARTFWEEAITKFPDFSPQQRWMHARVDWYQFGDSRLQLEVISRPDWPKFERHEALAALKHWQAGDMDNALKYARLIDPNDPREVNAIQPTDSDISRLAAEMIQAGILIASGASDEARAVLEPARDRLRQSISEAPDPHWTRLADLSDVLSLLDEHDAAIETAQAMRDRFDEPERTYRLLALHLANAGIMCEVGDLAATEDEMRWILSRENEETLASLVNKWPPCREKFEGTGHYQRLQEEFGHLSQGKTLD